MDNSENLFDINIILRNLAKHLRHVAEEKHIELIFDMHTSIPKQLRGDDITLDRLLTTLFTFVYKNTSSSEILLSLETTGDFLYEEDISFIIEKPEIDKEKILAFLESGLGQDLKTLEGEIVYEAGRDIHLKMPFKIGELGFRRHYRLPYTAMLDKKVFLLIESKNLAKSIANMFAYFGYEVRIGENEKSLNMAAYDLIVIENCLVIEDFAKLLRKAKTINNVKCVLLGEMNKGCACEGLVSMEIKKPVTQENIFELIVFLFEHVSPVKNDVEPYIETSDDEMALLDVKALFDLHHKEESEVHADEKLDAMIEDKRLKELAVLNVEEGEAHAKRMGLSYKDELRNFLDIFDHSDIYFRQIVQEKAVNKIKDFCIDLESKSKVIGAESMSSFADVVSLIFVYDKLDLLAIYPGRFHLELQKLVLEIDNYLRK